MTETPAPKAKRELIGQITYDPANHAFEDETLEHARRKSVSVWRRRSVRQQVVKHLRRIASEHGLTNEVGQFFNNKGYPPPHITLASMLRMYRLMEKQQGWMAAINEELRARLKYLDPVAFRHDEADLRARLRARQEERRAFYAEVAKEENTVRLPPKVSAAIGEALTLEFAQKERSVVSEFLPHREADLLGSRQIQKMMKFVFYDHLPEGDDSVPEDPVAQYRYLAAALNEAESQRAKLHENMYELREFIESADMVAREMG